jgi:hypothetical protein
MMKRQGLSELVRENPFFVLELPVECTAQEVERQAQKLLGMLELGLADAKQHWTPWGACERTSESVRMAAAALRDPARRLVCELAAQVPREQLLPTAEAPLQWAEATQLPGVPWRRG